MPSYEDDPLFQKAIDNGRNRVGFCSDCTHPLWNNKWNNKLEEKIKEHKL